MKVYDFSFYEHSKRSVIMRWLFAKKRSVSNSLNKTYSDSRENLAKHSIESLW